MDRERAKELLPIILAFVNGEKIQYQSTADGKWYDITVFVGGAGNYRIKPKPRDFWINAEDIPDWASAFGRRLYITTCAQSHDKWVKVREVLDE